MSQHDNLPFILVSNDDGYNAPGIKALVEVARKFGRVLMVAPSDAQSGMSHAITIKTPLRLTKLQDEENFTTYHCNGTPADCVKIAINKIADRKPDLVISGINHGSNTSASVFYSGTLAAAIEGSLNGIPAIGFSLTDLSWNADFSIAQKYAELMIRNALEKGLPKDKCLNVNIPALKESDIKGIKICRMTKGMWIEEFDHRKDPNNLDYYWLTGRFKNHEEQSLDTDEWAIANGYVSVVPLKVDFTCYDSLTELNDWNLTH